MLMKLRAINGHWVGPKGQVIRQMTDGEIAQALADETFNPTEVASTIEDVMDTREKE